MYVQDIKTDFYEKLSGQRVMLMVHYDIDSICTCKILQVLFKYKHIVYSLAVVRTVEELRMAYRENCDDDIPYYVLVNCGGTLDIVEVLEPDDHVVFFVLDSHRPTDLCNIYSNGQVRLLWQPHDDGSVPEFHDVFREDSDDEDEDAVAAAGSDDGDDDLLLADGDRETSASKRRRLDEQAILQRRERRQWEENRDKVMFEYLQFTYYAKSSAVLMYQLAARLNVDDKDLLWMAIVGITEQLLLGKIERTQYILEADGLQNHMQRLQNRTMDSDIATSLRISFEHDLHLVLYRHWTVESSIKYSQYTACKLRLWTLRGDKKMQELLLEMGLPLAQSKQSFRAMDLELRKEFKASIDKLSEKYGLTDIGYITFLLQFGYRHKYNASDVVYALLSILESGGRSKSSDECFNVALDCLSRSRVDILTGAFEKAKLIHISMFKTVQRALEMKSIVLAGPFVYFIVQEGSLDWHMFSQPHILSMLARFIIEAFVLTSKNKRAPRLPLLVSAPASLEEGTCVVLGIPPFCENSPKNFFGKAFEQAVERINTDVSCEFFDTSFFRIEVKHRTRFFDALTALLS